MHITDHHRILTLPLYLHQIFILQRYHCLIIITSPSKSSPGSSHFEIIVFIWVFRGPGELEDTHLGGGRDGLKGYVEVNIGSRGDGDGNGVIDDSSGSGRYGHCPMV